VLLPSGVAVRSVGRWWLWRGGNRIYRARGSCAAAASPRTRLHPTARRRNITGDRVAAAAVVVPSSPRQLRRRRRRSRERRGPFFVYLSATAALVHHSQQHEIFTLTLEQRKNRPTPLFRCSRKTLGAYNN